MTHMIMSMDMHNLVKIYYTFIRFVTFNSKLLDLIVQIMEVPMRLYMKSKNGWNGLTKPNLPRFVSEM